MPHDGLRLAFMGSPDFSNGTLCTLVEAGHSVVQVYAQPPRPAGRGQKQRLCPVHAEAEKLGIPVATPKSLKSAEEQAAFKALNLDAAVVVAYGLILPQAILDAPRLGCLNVHASLLPRWRGAAPIQRAIMAGDAETGVAIMKMDAGLDTGPVLAEARIPITESDTAGTLHDRLAALGADLMRATLPKYASGETQPMPQPDTGETYAAKIDKAEGALDFSKPAVELDRQIRALTPWPGAYFSVNECRVKVLAAEIVTGQSGAVPGTVLDDCLTIACAEGALRPTHIQREGKGAMETDICLRGFPVEVGTIVNA